MKSANVFFESFLDGFTMSGFINRLQQPGIATTIVAAPRTVVENFSEEVHVLPDQTIRSLFLILKKEIEVRHIEDHVPERVVHGS